MSNLYKIGTRGLLASDNNHLVYDAAVGRLYIDKDTPVDVVSADTIKESLGISSDGSATMYLNEQGNFVEAGGDSDTSFDSDFFIIEDDGTVTLKLAEAGTKGIAGFGLQEFNVDKGGFVSLKTRQVTSTNGLFTVDYVKKWETYSDGSWYRLWASGWLEQGGFIAPSSAKTVTTTMLMEFATTKYTIQVTHAANSTDTLAWRTGAYNKTTTTFTGYVAKGTGEGASWYACGWSA